jgi:hypothetical protein
MTAPWSSSTIGSDPTPTLRPDQPAAPRDSATRPDTRSEQTLGASYRDIAAALANGGYQPKRGEIWYPMTIRRILTRWRALAA